jgi:AcrR family transcriptional regulator
MLSTQTLVTLPGMEAARTYHHGNLRAALLDEAERSLSRRGATELSLRELARAVGVSHAAPRRHFADKQALLEALAEDGFERLGRELDGAMAAARGALREQLVAFARAYVHFATDHGALLELMFAGKHRPGADRLRAAADRAFAAPLALFAAAQASGEIVAGDPERVGVVALATLQGLASLANNGMLGDGDLDELVDDAVDRLVLGLKPR